MRISGECRYEKLGVCRVPQVVAMMVMIFGLQVDYNDGNFDHGGFEKIMMERLTMVSSPTVQIIIMTTVMWMIDHYGDDGLTHQGELATGLDWSDDGVHLAASTNSDLEILLWETNLCRLASISSISTLKFSSSSAPLSWRTLGAWSSPIQPSTCASSQVVQDSKMATHPSTDGCKETLNRNTEYNCFQGGGLLAVGDVDGGLRLVRLPAF